MGGEQEYKKEKALVIVHQVGETEQKKVLTNFEFSSTDGGVDELVAKLAKQLNIEEKVTKSEAWEEDFGEWVSLDSLGVFSVAKKFRLVVDAKPVKVDMDFKFTKQNSYEQAEWLAAVIKEMSKEKMLQALQKVYDFHEYDRFDQGWVTKEMTLGLMEHMKQGKGDPVFLYRLLYLFSQNFPGLNRQWAYEQPGGIELMIETIQSCPEDKPVQEVGANLLNFVFCPVTYESRQNGVGIKAGMLALNNIRKFANDQTVATRNMAMLGSVCMSDETVKALLDKEKEAFGALVKEMGDKYPDQKEEMKTILKKIAVANI